MRTATEKQYKAQRSWMHASAAHLQNISNCTSAYTNLVPKFVSTVALPNLNLLFPWWIHHLLINWSFWCNNCRRKTTVGQIVRLPLAPPYRNILSPVGCPSAKWHSKVSRPEGPQIHRRRHSRVFFYKTPMSVIRISCSIVDESPDSAIELSENTREIHRR